MTSATRAALILLGAAASHYGYALLPAAMQARVWNIAGAAGRLALLGAVLWPDLLRLAAGARAWLLLARQRVSGADWGAAIGRVAVLPAPRVGLALLAGAWWAAEEALVIGCNAAFLWHPWPVRAGEAACIGLLGFDPSPLGVLAAAVLALMLARR